MGVLNPIGALGRRERRGVARAPVRVTAVLWYAPLHARVVEPQFIAHLDGTVHDHQLQPVVVAGESIVEARRPDEGLAVAEARPLV